MSRDLSDTPDLVRADAAYRQLATRTAGFETLVVACHDAPEVRGPASAEGVVRLAGCVAELPLYRLIDLLAGVDAIVVQPCSTPASAGVPDQHTAVDRLAVLVGPRLRRSTSHDPTLGRSVEVLRVGEQPVGRRGLLGLRGGEPVVPRHTAADDQGRLLESLRWAGVRAPHGQGATPVPASRHLTATGCTACGMCVRTCPHQALTLAVDGRRATLRHRLAACHGEQACVAICPEDALSSGGPGAWADLLADRVEPLADVTVARCARCQGVHPAGEGDLCRVCRMRRDNPFASFPTPTWPS